MLKSGPLPKYFQLKEIIRHKVLSGEWQPGEPIPSELKLNKQYGISRMTVRQSITELVNEGFLYREHGRGTFVSEPKITQQLISLTGFTEDMQSRQQRPTAQVLNTSMIEAGDELAQQLRIKLGQGVFCCQRLRLADNIPMALETTNISFIGCEQLLNDDLSKNSLYNLLEVRYGQPPLEAEQQIEASLATEEVARLLKIQIGAPVLLIQRTTFTQRGVPIEFARSIYRGDRYRFYTRLDRIRVVN